MEAVNNPPPQPDPPPQPKKWWQEGTRWGSFGAGVMFLGIFPLVPLFFELGFTHDITSDSLMITGALSGLAVAVTSRGPALFAFFIVFTVLAAGFYGHTVPAASNAQQVFGTVAGIRLSATSKDNVSLGVIFFWALIGPFVAVIGQRFLRHMRRGDKFFEFG